LREEASSALPDHVSSHSSYGGLCYLGAPFVASMPNRFVRSATWTGMANPTDGSPSPILVDKMVKLAKGGFDGIVLYRVLTGLWLGGSPVKVEH
jgi:hypothetical protein